MTSFADQGKRKSVPIIEEPSVASNVEPHGEVKPVEEDGPAQGGNYLRLKDDDDALSYGKSMLSREYFLGLRGFSLIHFLEKGARG